MRSWLQELRQTDKRVYAKCVARIRLLAQLGHELRRPLADYLEGLEDADYEGHSLSMLQRIALALNQRIELHFVPLEKTSEAA